MSRPLPAVDRSDVLPQVWERLAPEDRTRLVRLLARLAYQALAETPEAPHQEVAHAPASRPVQDPS